MKLYHGGKGPVQNPHVIDNPRNDFGQGFYLCDTFDKAAEWAAGRHGKTGIVSEYDFDSFDNFSVLDFLDGNHNVFEWVATMLRYRSLDLSEDLIDVANFLVDNFSIDTSEYDIVIGYRADDGYFSIVSHFLSGQFDIDGLKHAMAQGLLGEQIVMKTQAAHDALYNPVFYGFDTYDMFLDYLHADGNRQNIATNTVNQINSHRGSHMYDLVNAYEDYYNADEYDRTDIEQRINNILWEGHIERK